jgi:hypothetical protein
MKRQSCSAREFHNRSLHEFGLPVVSRPYLFIGSLKTQSTYRLGDLDRIFLVGISTSAGMTDRNMLDVMPHAFACSNSPQCDHFPSLKLKASYLIE